MASDATVVRGLPSQNGFYIQTYFGPRWFTLPPPPPLPDSAPAIKHAQRREFMGCPTIDDIWVLREHEQEARNKARRADWDLRFKVLGPRSQDVPENAHV